ncbi:MAG TPA: YsnF/AvaK domain-containing protein [Polyangia bacterium]|nr:YsnF/AvaK domain-containing protein [Polyangia bacterium]
MKWDRMSVQEGMLVSSTAGQRIGKVIRCDAETFVVEKGALFPKDYQLRYDHITGIGSDGSITYSLEEELAREELAREKAERAGAATAAAPGAPRSETKDERREAKEERREERQERREAKEERREERQELGQGARPEAGVTPLQEARQEQDHEIRIPLLAEELDIEKYAYESGRVRIHKGIKVEERHFTVPVRREEVIVEHVSTGDLASGSAASAAESSLAFQDQDVDIPLHEEDIRVGKHTVVREEVVVRTVAHDVDVEGSASLRSEECDVEDSRGRPTRGAPGSGNGTGRYATASPR